MNGTYQPMKFTTEQVDGDANPFEYGGTFVKTGEDGAKTLGHFLGLESLVYDDTVDAENGPWPMYVTSFDDDELLGDKWFDWNVICQWADHHESIENTPAWLRILLVAWHSGWANFDANPSLYTRDELREDWGF